MFKFDMLKIQNLAYMEPELQKVALVVQHIYYLEKRVKFGPFSLNPSHACKVGTNLGIAKCVPGRGEPKAPTQIF
jgi:hypothetical protein